MHEKQCTMAGREIVKGTTLESDTNSVQRLYR